MQQTVHVEGTWLKINSNTNTNTNTTNSKSECKGACEFECEFVSVGENRNSNSNRNCNNNNNSKHNFAHTTTDLHMKMKNLRNTEVISENRTTALQFNMLTVDNASGCCNKQKQAKTLSNMTLHCKFKISNSKNHKHNCFKSSFGTITLILLLAICDYANAALRNVNLLMEPPVVRRGQSVYLRCDYNLDGAPLYSIKFSRGQLEFYRYTPGEYPNIKVFYYPGITVDESSSNATQVVIRNVSFNLSGNFSCEVTADAPLFSTAITYAQMQVVEFPEKRPQLFTEHTRYEPGDVLRANCSAPPSRPRAELRFTINNLPVTSEETQYIRTVDNLIASRLSLKLQLQALHFAAGAATTHMINALGNGGTGVGAGGVGVPYNTLGASNTAVGVGGLVLRCTAQIGDLYQEYKEIELGTPQKDPVPARVTLSSGSAFRNFFENYFSQSSSAKAITLNTSSMHWISYAVLAILMAAFQPQLELFNINDR